MRDEQRTNTTQADSQEKAQAAPVVQQPIRQLGEGFAQLEEKDDPYEDLGYRR
ncbi:hypothetical protein D3C81_2111670 [compost metagenome]